MRFSFKNNISVIIIIIFAFTANIIFLVLTKNTMAFCIFFLILFGFSAWYLISAFYSYSLYQRRDKRRAKIKYSEESANFNSNQIFSDVMKKSRMREEAWNTEYFRDERDRQLVEKEKNINAQMTKEPVCLNTQIDSRPIKENPNTNETFSDLAVKHEALVAIESQEPRVVNEAHIGALRDKYFDYERRAKEYTNMEGHEFEYFFADTISQIGYKDVIVTKGAGDFGVDVLAMYGGIRCAFQCKRYKGSVGIKAVQEVFTGKMHYGAERGIVVTTGKFTKQSKAMASECQVNLWGKDELQDVVDMALEVYKTKATNGFESQADIPIEAVVSKARDYEFRMDQVDSSSEYKSSRASTADVTEKLTRLEPQPDTNAYRTLQSLLPIFESSVYFVGTPTKGKYKDKIIEIIDRRTRLQIANLWCHVRRTDIVLPISVINRIPAEYNIRENCNEIKEDDMLKGQPAKSFRGIKDDTLMEIMRYMAVHIVM